MNLLNLCSLYFTRAYREFKNVWRYLCGLKFQNFIHFMTKISSVSDDISTYLSSWKILRREGIRHAASYLTLCCYNTCSMFTWNSVFLWMLMLLLPLRCNASDRSVLSSCHLHHLLVTSIDRCTPAARYEDDVVTWRQKLTVATTVC